MFIRRHSSPVKASPRFRVRRFVASDGSRVQELIATGLMEMIPQTVSQLSWMWHVLIPQCLSILLAGTGIAWALQAYLPVYVSFLGGAIAFRLLFIQLLKFYCTRSLRQYINMSLRTDLSNILQYYQGEGVQWKPKRGASGAGPKNTHSSTAGTNTETTALVQADRNNVIKTELPNGLRRRGSSESLVPSIPSQTEEEGEEGEEEEEEADNFWVCEVVELGKDEPWVVGCVGMDVNSQTFPGSVELRRMSVEHSYRHLGVAKMLMEALEKRAQEVHASKVWLEIMVYQTSAIQAYTRMGWVIVRTLKYSWDVQVVQMCRVLQSSSP